MCHLFDRNVELCGKLARSLIIVHVLRLIHALGLLFPSNHTMYLVPLTKKTLLVQLSLNNSGAGTSVPSTAFFGKTLKKVNTKGASSPKVSNRSFRITFTAQQPEIDEKKQTEQDRWKGLVSDTSDDQQDITRGKGMVDPLFQAPVGTGTHHAVLSSYEYISQGLRQ